MTETEKALLKKVIRDTQEPECLRLIANYLMNGLENGFDEEECPVCEPAWRGRNEDMIGFGGAKRYQ